MRFAGSPSRAGGAPVYHTATADGIIADEYSMFRVASVSKIVTAAALEIGAGAISGLERPYDLDAGPILDLDLRNPLFPDRPVTLGMLMTHTSGLVDTAGYTIEPPLRDAFDPAAMFGHHAPGTYFCYCNLGYVLLAAAAEKLSGERFDRIVRDEVLGPQGMIGGFNWAGLTAQERGGFLPTYRRDGADFVPMIDVTEPAPFDPGGDYELGQHTARLSPQGGLRTSLRGMIELAMTGAGVSRTPLWRQTDGDGDYLDGLFQDYGIGEQILPNPPFYPRPLVGHFGNAYGFNGGVWWDSEANVCFAFALNGVPMGDESDVLSAAERAVFASVAQVA